MAEKAIQSFKNHLIAILSGVNKRFPMHLWERLPPQTEMTLNMLKATNIRPWVSGQTYLHGQHDYNRMPLAPLGCHTMTHNKRKTRTSWGPSASEGFYVGTSTEHYHCFKIWTKDTRSIHISDTVHFHYKFITAPSTMQENKVTTAAKNLTNALLTTTLVQLNEMDKQALQCLNKYFTKYKANDMILAIHSDASYLSAPRAQSHAGGHFFSQATKNSPPTMVQSTTLPKSSGPSCHSLQKWHLVPCS